MPEVIVYIEPGCVIRFMAVSALLCGLCERERSVLILCRVVSSQLRGFRRIVVVGGWVLILFHICRRKNQELWGRRNVMTKHYIHIERDETSRELL